MQEKPADSVIWIASYPKSGNTWVQAVTRVAGKSFGFPTEDIDVYKMKAEKREPAVVQGIRPEVSPKRTTVLKTHAGFAEQRPPHAELGLQTAGFVYVMRNPLDMLLSYINFTRIPYERNQDNAAFKENLFINLLGFDSAPSFEEWRETTLESIPRATLDHALKRFAELDTEIPGMRMTGGSWLKHCLSWHKMGEKMPSVLFRYEDLLKGPENFLPLQRLFTFSDKQITNAASNVDQGLRALQGKRIFFNKMSAYYYQEFFSPEVVKAFLDQYESELKTLGYADLYEKAQ